jgi:hypothetical protein
MVETNTTISEDNDGENDNLLSALENVGKQLKHNLNLQTADKGSDSANSASVSMQVDPSTLAKISLPKSYGNQMLGSQAAPIGIGTALGGYTRFGGYHVDSSSYFDQIRPSKPIEFKMLDGSVSIMTLNFGNIKELTQRTLKKKTFSWKFPFIATTERNYTHVVYDHGSSISVYDIDCNLPMFMNLIGQDYKGWSETMMSEAIKHGAEIN